MPHYLIPSRALKIFINSWDDPENNSSTLRFKKSCDDLLMYLNFSSATHTNVCVFNSMVPARYGNEYYAIKISASKVSSIMWFSDNNLARENIHHTLDTNFIY